MIPENREQQEFVSEPITPASGAFDAAAMARGEPGAPAGFTWRGRTYAVARVTARWKSSTPDRGELYLRRHWFALDTTTGEHMTIYCERQTKNRIQPKARWWLYSVGR